MKFNPARQTSNECHPFFCLIYLQQVCAVCARYTASKEAPFMPIADVPQFDVLRADGDSTSVCPRQAVTVIVIGGQRYCLLDTHSVAQGRADLSLAAHDDNSGFVVETGVCSVRRDSNGDVTALRICDACLEALKKASVPMHSLVRVDPGIRPPELEQLTAIEEIIVAPLRVTRKVIVLRPAGTAFWQPNDALHRALRGHIISFSSGAPQQLSTLLPLRPEALPEHVNVILIAPCQDDDEVKNDLS
jgi:hypothetical protein